MEEKREQRNEKEVCMTRSNFDQKEGKGRTLPDQSEAGKQESHIPIQRAEANESSS